MKDAEIVEQGRRFFYDKGDRPGENPYIAGTAHLREAQLWHRGFAEARQAKRQSQPAVHGPHAILPSRLSWE